MADPNYELLFKNMTDTKSIHKLSDEEFQAYLHKIVDNLQSVEDISLGFFDFEIILINGYTIYIGTSESHSPPQILEKETHGVLFIAKDERFKWFKDYLKLYAA